MLLTSYGVHIPAIGSLVPTMPKSSALIRGFTSPVRVALMHFLRIGLIRNNWLCPHPSVYLTCKVIKHMELCSAQGTLIVPLWKSAHFWPILCSDGRHWSIFIHDWVILPNFPNLFIRGKAKNSIFGGMPLAFVSLALCLDFSIASRLDSELSRKSFLVPCF